MRILQRLALKILLSINQTCEDVFQLAGEIEQTFIVVIIFLCLFVCFLQILTNAPPLVYRWRTSTWQTFVIRTRTAPTPKDLTTAAVRKGMREMETIVKVGYDFILFFLFYFLGGGWGDVHNA